MFCFNYNKKIRFTNDKANFFFCSNDFLKFSHCLIFLFFTFFCRAEIKTQHQGVSPKREKLTEWLSSSIAELRLEISELQASASNLTKSCHQRNLFTEDIRGIRDEMNTFKLELKAMKTRQDKTDVIVRELREEIIQSSEDFGKSSTKHKKVSVINKLRIVELFSCHLRRQGIDFLSGVSHPPLVRPRSSGFFIYLFLLGKNSQLTSSISN